MRITLTLKIPITKRLSKEKRTRLFDMMKRWSNMARWYLREIQNNPLFTNPENPKNCNKGKIYSLYGKNARGLSNLPRHILYEAGEKARESQRSYLEKREKDKKANPPNFDGLFMLGLQHDTYKIDKTEKGTYILCFSTKEGRDKKNRLYVPIFPSDYHLQVLEDFGFELGKQDIQGRAEIHYSRRGGFWLHLTIKKEVNRKTTINLIGVDIGINKLAAVSTADGSVNIFFDGSWIKHKGRRQASKIKELQEKKLNRVVKTLKIKQSNRKRWLNHNIAKKIIDIALENEADIVLERLKGIRQRVALDKPKGEKGKNFNRKISNWAYFELYQFIKYKATLSGLKVYEIDPGHTSTICSRCGYDDKGNRKNQSTFICKKCGFQINADLNAARNIAKYGWSLKRKDDKKLALNEQADKSELLSGHIPDNTGDVSSPLCGGMTAPQSLNPAVRGISFKFSSERQSVDFRQDEEKTDGEQLFFQDFESSISDHSQTVFSAIKLKKGGGEKKAKKFSLGNCLSNAVDKRILGRAGTKRGFRRD